MRDCNKTQDDSWARTIDWTLGTDTLAWFAMAWTDDPDGAQALAARTREIIAGRDQDPTIVQLHNVPEDLDRLTSSVREHPSILIVNTVHANLDPTEARTLFATTALALNRAREVFRREVRIGVVIVAQPAHRTELRDLAPDLKSVIWCKRRRKTRPR